MYYYFTIKRNGVKTYVYIDPSKEVIELYHYMLMRWNDKTPPNAEVVKKFKNRKLVYWCEAISFDTWWQVTGNLAEIESKHDSQ